MLWVGRGDEIDMRPTLSRYPTRLTSVREYADRVLAG
jgi:hypothetical protein